MNGSPQDERNFLVDLIFKPTEPDQRLRPAETQLLLAYIGEILREVEAEERRIIAEEQKAIDSEVTPCE